MKILAFSDPHRDVKALQNIMLESDSADVLIGAGDFATRGLGTNDTMSILTGAKVPVIIVPGNHDNTKTLRTICDRFENIHLLHGEIKIINDVSFFGLGDEIPHQSNVDWNQSLSEDDAADMLQHCPCGGVLITHSPPLGYCDQQGDGTHEGSRAIRDTIKLKQPVLNLCGHIHEAWNTTAMIGQTQVFNLGPTSHWFEI